MCDVRWTMQRSEVAALGVVLLSLTVASGRAADALPRRLDLVSNEGQAPTQVAERAWLVTNPAAPEPPDRSPPADGAGLGWDAPGYDETSAGGWIEALPVWRDEDWPRTTLPMDAAGRVTADWLWASPLDPELWPALLLPDAGNGTAYPRRQRDGAGFDHGYVPGMLDGAVYLRRDFCLPSNLAAAPVTSLVVLADSQARVRVNGAAVADTCPATPAACAALGQPGYATPSVTSPPLLPGPNALGVVAWTWQPGAVLGGVLWHLAVDYDTTPANAALEPPVFTEDSLLVPVRVDAGADFPTGTRLTVGLGGAATATVLPLLPAGSSRVVALDVAFVGPGALATVQLDAADCAGRPAGGARNLLGGASLADGSARSAIGLVEETDEADGRRDVRRPPRFSSAHDGSAVATETALVQGESAPGTRVIVRRAGVPVAVGAATGAGSFSVTVPLEVGENVLDAFADADGLPSAPTAPIVILRELEPPAAPVILAPLAGEVRETDRLDPFPVEISGTGRAGAQLAVTLSAGSGCDAVVAADGTWRCLAGVDQPGTITVTARQTSRAGLVSPPAEVEFEVVLLRPDGGEADAGAEPDAGGDPDAGELPDGGEIADAGEPADAGGAVDGGGEATDAGDAGGTPPLLVAAGGGGCASAGGSALSWSAAGLLLAALLRRRRHLTAGLLVLALGSAAAPARAQVATPLGPAPFPGPTPLVPAAAPRSGGRLASWLALDYARDPVVLLDARDGRRVGALIGDRLDARLTVGWVATPWLELALTLPTSPFQRGDSLGVPVGSAGLGDVSASALVGLRQAPALSLGLLAWGSAASATAPLLGSGGALGAALVANGLAGPVAWGLSVGARTATGGLGPAVTPLSQAPRLEARAGAALALLDGFVTPFLEAAASAPGDRLGSGGASVVVASAGLRLAVGPVEVTLGAGRGLTPAPGSPAFSGTLQVGLVPGAIGRPVPASEPLHAPGPAPTIVWPEEGAVVAEQRPLVEGDAEPGAEVTLTLDGRLTVRIRADAQGRFGATFPEELTLGTHVLQAQQRTAGGRSELATRSFVHELMMLADPDDLRRRSIAQILQASAEQVRLQARATPEGVAVATDLYFDFDSDAIRAEQEWKLRDLEQLLKAFPWVHGRIESHTDSVGDRAYNLDLSRRRAAAVVKWLVEVGGIAPSRLSWTGYADTRPVAPNSTPEGRARNRRFADCVLVVP